MTQCFVGGEVTHHPVEPAPVQDPRLVPQQTEGREGRQVLASHVQQSRQQAERGSHTATEDQESPRPASLLGVSLGGVTGQFWAQGYM